MKTTMPRRVKPDRDRPSGTPTLVVRGQGERRVVPIGQRGVTVGRGDECDVQIEDEGLSRAHAKVLAASDGVVHVMDLGSTNGTYVNGERIDMKLLRPGDRIQFGPDVEGELTYQSPGEGSNALAGLTPRQLEVACFVAEGLTSAEIAKRLGVSTRTITSHLDRIYERLDITSRAALASRVATAGLVKKV